MTLFFGNMGQRYLAGANLVVVGEDNQAYDSFMEKVVQAASRIIIGWGLDESVQMGPLQSKDKKEKSIR